MATKLDVISLFSGAGGLDYGLEAAGFRTKVAVEAQHDCCETLRKNRRFAVIERDIHEVSAQDILSAGKLKRGEVDLVIGGPPCQPFSKSGYWASGDAARLSDPRSNTLWAYTRVVEETLPKAFLLENVHGLSYTNKAEGLTALLAEIERINRRHRVSYRPVFKVLRAADYGVPQIRERFVMVAARDGAPFSFPAATHYDLSQPRGLESLWDQRQEPYRTAWDALADLPMDPNEDLSLRGRWADLLPSVPEGQNYLWHTDRGGGRALFGWRRRYWCFLLKLAKDKPSWTLQAQPGPATGPFHWSNRLLSMRELCRIQTFPDDVHITGNRIAVQRQAGNAVPSLLAEVLGREIRVQLLGASPLRGNLKLLPPCRGAVPAAERVRPVPAKYLPLEGDHPAHPGTGLGFGALARAEAANR